MIIREIVLNLAAIAFIYTYVIEYSGITTEINRMIYKIRGKVYNYQPLMKPFGCSVCMTFWTTIIFLLINNHSIILSVFLGVINALSISIYKKIINYYLEKTF
jgi:hypothetical protein